MTRIEETPYSNSIGDLNYSPIEILNMHIEDFNNLQFRQRRVIQDEIERDALLMPRGIISNRFRRSNLLFLEILDFLTKKKVVQDYEYFKVGSYPDTAWIDYAVRSDGILIPFQITSGEESKRERIKKIEDLYCLSHFFTIPVVGMFVDNQLQSKEVALREINQIIENYKCFSPLAIMQKESQALQKVINLIQ